MKKIKDFFYHTKFIIAWPVLKNFTDFFIIIYALIQKKNQRSFSSTAVYISVNKDCFSISILSMLSFQRQFSNTKFIIISDRTLSSIHYRIYQKIFSGISLVYEDDNAYIKSKLKKYHYLKKYFEYGWSGKKFLVPLLLNEYEQIIILDADILTFRFPKQIDTWLKNNNQDCLFMSDYENFSAISRTEAKKLLGREPRFKDLNSGFLCIYKRQFMKYNNLASLNKDILQAVKFTKDRLRYDEDVSNDIYYVYPIIEQTLYWLGFERFKARHLNKQDYFIFPNHKFKKKAIKNPVMIHFSGEGIKKSMYKYLIYSFLEKIQDMLSNNLRNDRPWFIYSQNFCPNCRHNIKQFKKI